MLQMEGSRAESEQQRAEIDALREQLAAPLKVPLRIELGLFACFIILLVLTRELRLPAPTSFLLSRRFAPAVWIVAAAAEGTRHRARGRNLQR